MGKGTCHIFLEPGTLGTEEPCHVEGTLEGIIAAFDKIFTILRRRVQAMVDIPLDTRSKEAITEELKKIGSEITSPK